MAFGNGKYWANDDTFKALYSHTWSYRQVLGVKTSQNSTRNSPMVLKIILSNIEGFKIELFCSLDC